MKITNIKTYLLEKKLSSSMQISRGGFSHRYHAIIRVETDEGLVGYGEGIGNAQAVVSLLKSIVAKDAIGLDPLNISVLRQRLLDSHVYYEQKGSYICALSALEMACWDIKAKACGLPLFELLGGARINSVPLYASDVYWEDDISRMVSRCEAVRDLGIKAIKIHIGRLDPKSETDRVRAVRESIGDDCRLMIDLNCGYDLNQALKASELWAPYEIYWLEEPMPPYSMENYKELSRRSAIPIACGENEFLVHGFRQLIQSGGVRFLMPDLGRVGGLKEAMDVCALARSHACSVSLHNYSSGILLAFSLAFTASQEPCQLLEYDASDNAFYQDLFQREFEITDGSMYVSSQPGIGVAISEKILSPYEI